MKVFTISDSYLQVVQGTTDVNQVESIAIGLLGIIDPNDPTITYSVSNIIAPVRQDFIDAIYGNSLNGGMFISSGRTTVSVAWVTV